MRKLRIRRACVAVLMRMYFPFWLLWEPQLEFVLFTYMLTPSWLPIINIVGNAVKSVIALVALYFKDYESSHVSRHLLPLIFKYRYTESCLGHEGKFFHSSSPHHLLIHTNKYVTFVSWRYNSLYDVELAKFSLNLNVHFCPFSIAN